MILTDTFIVENAELITEERGGKTVRRLRGIFGRCDEKNNNGRIYSKKLLEREVTNITEAMAERRLMGELDHPTHNAVKLSNVSHLITGLSFKGNELVGECELLDTPSGKVAQALVEGGVKVGISSRGMGTLSEHSDGTKTVNEDYKLVTFDLVADPSTRGAFPGLSESTLIEGIVQDTLGKAAKEKVFTTLLRDKLREKGEYNQTPAKLLTVAELQKKADKKAKKPTPEDPFRSWEDYYGPNTGPPRVARKTRGYNDAETVTAPQKVVENKYGALKVLLGEQSEAPKEVNEFSFLSLILTEAKKKTDSTKTSARKALYSAAKGAGKTRRKKINKDSKKAKAAAVLGREIEGLKGWINHDHAEDPGQGATSRTAHHRRTHRNSPW